MWEIKFRWRHSTPVSIFLYEIEIRKWDEVGSVLFFWDVESGSEIELFRDPEFDRFGTVKSGFWRIGFEVA